MVSVFAFLKYKSLYLENDVQVARVGGGGGGPPTPSTPPPGYGPEFTTSIWPWLLLRG